MGNGVGAGCHGDRAVKGASADTMGHAFGSFLCEITI